MTEKRLAVCIGCGSSAPAEAQGMPEGWAMVPRGGQENPGDLTAIENWVDICNACMTQMLKESQDDR